MIGMSDANLEMLQVLGQGGEGTAYVTRDRETGRKHVLKVFREPVPYNVSTGLCDYADRVAFNDVGLFPVQLIKNAAGIIGLRYPFVSLQHVHPRITHLSREVAQAYFAAYCHMQAYLMGRCGLGLTDTLISHFLLAEDGLFYFVDYGIHIHQVDHAWTLDHGLYGYGFAMMLLSIYSLNIKPEWYPAPCYPYSRPCIYCQSEALDALGERHAWVRKVVSEVRSHDASVLLQPEFYQHVSADLPRRVRSPRLVRGMSRLLFSLKPVKALFRPRCGPTPKSSGDGHD